MIISQTENGHTVIVNRGILTYDGVDYELPKFSSKRKYHSLSTINGKTFIDGYEFKNGTFKRTLAALFHLIF